MSTTLVNEAVQEYLRVHYEYIEMMAAAYFKRTSIPPDQVVLVEQRRSETEIHFYLARKESTDALPMDASRATPAQTDSLAQAQGTGEA